MRLNSAILVISFAFLVRYTAQQQVSPKDFPFFGTVLFKNRAICGAILYATDRLVTTCHCLLEDASGTFQAPHVLKDSAFIDVDMGIDGERPTGTLRHARSIDVHPKCQCTSRAMLYDFAVIELVEPFFVKKGEIEVANILMEKLEIRRVFEAPGDYWCILLDFEIIKRRRVVDLGFLKKSSVTLETGAWCDDKYTVFIKNRDFNKDIQTCSNSYEKPCGQPDLGGPVICSKTETFDDKLPVGLLSGRHHPYCGKYFHFVIYEVYARMDPAVDWLNIWVPPTTTTAATTSGSTDVTTVPTSTRKSTTHRDCGDGGASSGPIHPLLYPAIPFLLAYVPPRPP